MKTDVNLFSRLLSLSRKQYVDVQNVLSRELCAVPLHLLISKCWHISKSNLLNKIEIKRYSLPSLWEILILVQLVLISWQCYNIYSLQQVRKIFKCSWWSFCKTPFKPSWIWSAGCSYWSIWFWIFNESCW